MSGFRCPSCSAAQTVEAVERVAGRVVCRSCGASTSLEVSDPFGTADEHLDLPAPKSKFADLPAPRKAATPPPLPVGGDDLPAPVFRNANPNKNPNKSRRTDNLPAPRNATPRAATPPPLPPPTPSSRPRPALPDLLAPVGSSTPMPRSQVGSSDLPAPKGFFDDSPSFAEAPADLPAPKGFFDDAVVPKNEPRPTGEPTDLPAPKGFFDSAVAPKNDPFAAGGPADLPAPKGFFDSAVAPKNDPFAAGGPSDLPAPKGFFDDAVAPYDGGGSPATGGGSLPAPKGFFDDAVAPLSDTPGAGPGNLPAPKGIFDDLASPSTLGDSGFDLGEPLDLGGPDLSAPSGGGPVNFNNPLNNPPNNPPNNPGGGLGDPGSAFDLGDPLDEPFGAGLDLGDPLGGDSLELGSSQGQPIDLGGPSAPPLDLSGPGPDSQRPFGLDDLELEAPALGPSRIPSDTGSAFEGVALPGAQVGPSAPPPGGDGVVSFSTPSDSAVAAGQQGLARRRPSEQQGPLELDNSPLPVEQAAEARKTLARERTSGVSSAPPVANKKKRLVVALAAVLGVAAVGAGGFFGYTKWAASKSTSQEVDAAVATARKHLIADRPGHWDEAVKAAKRALGADNKSPEALAIAAQGLFASAVDNGVNRAAKIAEGKKLMTQLRAQAAKGAEVHKAEGLQAVVERRGGDAIKQLTAARAANPRDSSLDLYLGWAQLLVRNFPLAEKSFSAALKSSPGRVAALYGLGRAQQGQGKDAEARTSFQSAIDKSRERYKVDHVGALVGAAELAEVERFTDRENRYLEILARGDLSKADPAAIARAWTLAGDEALRAGRLQEATQRYAKALELDGGSRAAVVGEGKALLAMKRYTEARERLTRVLGVDPANLDANLALAEVALREENVTETKTLVNKVLERKPPINDKVLLSGAHRVLAGAYALEPKDAEAESEYREAIKLASDHDIRAALDLANFFVSRQRGEEAKAVLEPIRARADTDPGIGVSLGVAYLGAEDAVSAEEVLRKALELRPGDPEARYQLGQALLAQKRTDEGLAAIRAAYEANKGREDIGLALAIAYEQKKRFKDASALYETLLAAESPSLNVKASAGRYFARHDAIARAIALGEEILAESKDNAAGLFLLGEKHFQANEFDKAQRAYLDAASLDKEAQYLEGAGRASEKQRNFDDAVRHYENALNLEPDYLSALYGQARIHLSRRAFREAISALDRAIAIEAKDAWPFAARGIALIELGQLADGVKSLARAVSLDPDLAEAHYRLGRAYYDLDKARASAVSLERATNKSSGDEPWLTEAYRVLGYAHRMARNRAGAIKAFRAYLARDPEKGPQRTDAKRELLFLEGGGR